MQDIDVLRHFLVTLVLRILKDLDIRHGDIIAST